MSYKTSHATSEISLDAFWRTHCSESSWNFVTSGLHNGDLYFCLSLMRYFKVCLSRNAPVRFLADSIGKHAILKSFSEVVDDATYCEDLAAFSPQEISQWCLENGRSAFGPGQLTLLHPLAHCNLQFQLAPIVYSRGQYNLMDLFKGVLGVPGWVAPSPAAVSDANRQCARECFEEQEFLFNRTIVLFPYAQTLPLDVTALFTEVARLALAEGFSVCTAVHATEEAIFGTRAVRISFDILAAFCEFSGYVVGVRSGIGDMLAACRVHKVYLYPNDVFVSHESPIAYGLGDCSHGMPFEGADIRATAHAIVASLKQDLFSRKDDFIPHMILRYFENVSILPDKYVFNAASGCRIGRYIFFRGAALAEGWCELEDWGVWSLGYRSFIYLQAPASGITADKSPRALELECFFVLPEETNRLNVIVSLNGRAINFVADTTYAKWIIPLSEYERTRGFHQLMLEPLNPKPPESAQEQFISIGLMSAQYQWFEILR